MRVPTLVKNIGKIFLWIAILPPSAAILIVSGYRLFVAVMDGTVRLLTQDHLLTYQGEPAGFIIAVVFYVLIAGLSFALLAFWFIKQPMRLESSPALIGAIEFIIWTGGIAVLLVPIVPKARIMLASLYAKRPPIERPPQVQALIARLGTLQGG